MVMVDSLRFLYFKYNYCNLFLISLIPYVVSYVSNECGTTRHDAIQWDTIRYNAMRQDAIHCDTGIQYDAIPLVSYVMLIITSPIM